MILAETQVVKLLFGHASKKQICSQHMAQHQCSVSTNVQKVHIFVQNMAQMLRELYPYYQKT